MGNFSRRLSDTLNGNAVWWRWFTNLGPTLAWRRSRPVLTATQQRVVSELKTNGVSSVHVTELLPELSLWEEMQKAVEELDRAHEAEIRDAKENPDPSKRKNYLIKLLGTRPLMDPESIFVRFSAHRDILAIAHAYFGMYVRMSQYNVWHNVPAPGDPKNSQLWHTDPGDRHLLRLFLYMNDVGPGNGPLSYVKGSHALGARKIRPEAFLEETTLRSTDEQMKKVAPPETWVTATGKKGTIWFVDTRGYHKGGHVLESDRLLYNVMWTSNAHTKGEYYARTGKIVPQTDPGAAFALDLPMVGEKAPARKTQPKEQPAEMM